MCLWLVKDAGVYQSSRTKKVDVFDPILPAPSKLFTNDTCFNFLAYPQMKQLWRDVVYIYRIHGQRYQVPLRRLLLGCSLDSSSYEWSM